MNNASAYSVIESGKMLISRFRRLIGCVLVCYWVALFYGTHARIPSLHRLPHNSDKGLHFLAYGGLAFLLILWLSTFRQIRFKHVALVVAATAGYGVLDELLQALLPYRDCDVYDLLADLVGIGIGLLAFWITRVLFARLWVPAEQR